MTQPTTIFRSEPPIPRDGSCAYCRGPRKLPTKLHREQAARDPFCSTECAKDYYGVPRYNPDPGPRR